MADNDIIGEKLQSILSNPESLKSILQIASGLGIKTPEIQAHSQTEEREAVAEQQKLPEPQKILSSSASSRGLYSDDRMNLLLSIKPFLNEKKRQRIDSVIKAMQAAKIINAYKDTDLFSNFGIK